MSRPPLSKEDKEALERMGRNVARFRKSRGYTQEQFAELVDLHPRVVQKIEYGQTNLRTTTTARILRVLAVTWEALCGPAGPAVAGELAAVAEAPSEVPAAGPSSSRKPGKTRKNVRRSIQA